MLRKLTNRIIPWGAIGLSLVFICTSHAGVLEDFQFNDSNGTTLGDAANSANNGNNWEPSTQLNNSSVLNGVFRIQNDDPGLNSSYLQIDNITSGTVWMVAEMDGWNFTPDPSGVSGDFEEIRFGFLTNDDLTGSTITAQMEIERNSTTGGIEINGQALGVGSNISATSLSFNQAQPFTSVLKLDKTANTYQILIDDGSGFTSIGSGNVDPARDGNSIRFSIGDNFAGSGEFFDVDRFYITDVDPVGIETDNLTLQVNTTTGMMEILNDGTTPFDIDWYRIESTTDDLNFNGWSSLSDRSVDAIDGIDPDSTVGNGIGETWDEAGGSDDGVLSESFLQSSSVFGNNRSETLGSAFKVGGDTDSLTFEYRSAINGAVFTGDIDFVTGGLAADINGDLKVDGADFLQIQRDNPSLIPNFQAEYGAGSSAQASSSAVPEPTALSLLAVMLAVTTLGVRRREVA
ncbi:hypothetical protein [Adhaeretor mobilis]|uniref:PEP-CTERM protein-sorting domain-containing protein n=1 Tax=Adhaeretor mobilis TaxID=1930276 RepID=A0A517N107_9BACT|nr:hypothetical protein [Adhaeretor mobilis]QDT00815.1 hypothetical protein HG15A2_41570 [Adhaeretor mobilis]